METFIEFLIAHGGVGMFFAAFLAGSFIPFSSEAVMLGLLAAGVDPSDLLMWGTAGNTLGSLFNYGVGSLGREEWIARWTKVSPEKLERGKRWVRRYGVWGGLLAWLPIIGSVITVAMGFLRTQLLPSIFVIGVGKFVRYWIIVRTYLAA